MFNIYFSLLTGGIFGEEGNEKVNYDEADITEDLGNQNAYSKGEPSTPRGSSILIQFAGTAVGELFPPYLVAPNHTI